MRHLFLCAVLSCCGCAGPQDEPVSAEPEIATEETIFDLSDAEIERAKKRSGPPATSDYKPHPDQWPWQLYRVARAKPVNVAVRVRLALDGRPMVETNKGWQGVTIDEFMEFLVLAAKRHHAQRQAIGKSGYEFDRSGMSNEGTSRIFVELDIHPESPWQHLEWLMTACEVRGIDKLQLVVGRRLVHVFLPWDAAIEWTRPPPLTSAAVLILARGEVDTKRNGASIRVPTRMSYRAGGQDIAGWTQARGYLEMARKTAATEKPDHAFVAALMAERTVPANRIMEAIEMLTNAGMERVRFYDWGESTKGTEFRGVRSPSLAERRLKVLPYPK